MTRFSKAQTGILVGSLVLAVSFANIDKLISIWPFEQAQIAEVSITPIPGEQASYLHFNPNAINISQAGPENSQTVTLLAKIAQENITPDGFTLALEYDDTLIAISALESISPYTQQLGNVDLTKSPLRFTYVKDIGSSDNRVLGAAIIAQLGMGGNPVCTQDTFICPDGTTISRSGPSCTFVCQDSSPTIVPISDPNITPTPSPSTVPIPTTSSSYSLVRLTFYAKHLPPATSPTTRITFRETSVVSASADGSIVDYGEDLQVTFVPPTFKPGDLNQDGSVNLFDYQELITNYGNPYTIFDYQKIITHYGQ